MHHNAITDSARRGLSGVGSGLHLRAAIVHPAAQGFGSVHKLTATVLDLIGQHVAAFLAAAHAHPCARGDVDAHGIRAAMKVAGGGFPLGRTWAFEGQALVFKVGNRVGE
jgi:hypothetical protein